MSIMDTEYFQGLNAWQKILTVDLNGESFHLCFHVIKKTNRCYYMHDLYMIFIDIDASGSEYKFILCCVYSIID